MHRLARLLLVVLLALATAIPVGASPGVPRVQADPEQWLAVDRSVVTWSESVTFSATLVTIAIAIVPAPEATIELERSMDDGRTWGRIGVRLLADGRGGYAATHRPRLTALYRAILLDGSGSVTATSAPAGVLVRQLAIQRPVHQPAKSLARGTSVTFATTIRPIGPDLPSPRVLFLVYQRTAGMWRQVDAREVPADATGVARFTYRFRSAGEFSVRSKGTGTWTPDGNTVLTFVSVLTPIAHYRVR